MFGHKIPRLSFPGLERAFGPKTVFAVAALICVSAMGSGDGVFEPEEDQFVLAEPGGVFSVIVRLRLPLTPPPGVQQHQAKAGWRAQLIGSALTPDAPTARVEYSLKVVKIRPERKDSYRVVLMTLPWILPGTYDLELRGPGYHDDFSHAVRVTGGVSKDESPRVFYEMRDKGQLRALVAGAGRWVFDVAVPQGGSGVKVALDGRALDPIAVAWRTIDESDAALEPVLRFMVNMEDIGRTTKYANEMTVLAPMEIESPSAHRLSFSSVPSLSCRGHITGNRSVSGRRRLLSEKLTFSGQGDDFLAVAWVFGDGKVGLGNPVRHRFLLGDRSNAKAIGADKYGRTCRGSWRPEVPDEREVGCGCSLWRHPGRGGLAPWICSIF